MGSRSRPPRDGVDWLGTLLIAVLMLALVAITMR